MFWVAAAGLLLTGACLVAWPLLRKEPSGGEDRASRDATVRALYQDRLAEIAAEANAGQVDPEDQAQVEAELGSALLADFREDGESRVHTGGNKRLAAAMALLTLTASLGLYLVLGDPDADSLVGASSVIRLDPATHGAELAAWRDRLSQRVGTRTDDAQSWYLLGHSEFALGRYQQAAEAFATAHVYHGEDPSIDLYWLQARYLAADGQIDAASRSIAERLLAVQPNQPLVLEIFAVEAFHNGRYREAVGFLNRALARAIGARQREALGAGMAAARAELGDLNPSVDVNVALSATPPHGATLFVIARPVGGGMPYAVVRRPAAGFPLVIRLDDAVSMNPAQGLSQAAEVEIVVRLSLSGAPMAHPGDWEWRSAVLPLPEASVPLQLDALLSPPGAGT
jgi:cytochrome c-type biogenesis protein CcmH